MNLSKQTRIYLLLILDITFFLIELVTGNYVGSLVLITDSFHLLNDIISLVVALYAVKVNKSAAFYFFAFIYYYY